MLRQRSIFSLILVLLTTFLISCGGPSVATAPPTYTQEQLVKIQEYLPDIEVVRDRSDELKNLIDDRDWIKVNNFIHGPITEARLNMTYIIPDLLPQDQPQARKITKDLLNHLVRIEQGARANQPSVAMMGYENTWDDFDKFLQLIPDQVSE